MISKLFKPAAILAVGTVLVGFFLFGGSFLSYLRTSSRVVQKAAQDSVSVEFELHRARDLVDEILPQLQANVRLIAEEEVEIAALQADIAASQERLSQTQRKLVSLRDRMQLQQVSYAVGGHELSRDQLTERLAGEFQRYREAELILASKQKLLDTRRVSLHNALQMHERAKHQKLQLEQKIESLVAKHRLVQSSSMGTQVAVDGSRLNRADQLLAQIERRLDVSQRILDHESDLHEIQLDSEAVDETELLAEFDEHFASEESEQLVAKQAPVR